MHPLETASGTQRNPAQTHARRRPGTRKHGNSPGSEAPQAPRRTTSLSTSRGTTCRSSSSRSWRRSSSVAWCTAQCFPDIPARALGRRRRRRDRRPRHRHRLPRWHVPWQRSLHPLPVRSGDQPHAGRHRRQHGSGTRRRSAAPCRSSPPTWPPRASASRPLRAPSRRSPTRRRPRRPGRRERRRHRGERCRDRANAGRIAANANGVGADAADAANAARIDALEAAWPTWAGMDEDVLRDLQNQIASSARRHRYRPGPGRSRRSARRTAPTTWRSRRWLPPTRTPPTSPP